MEAKHLVIGVVIFGLLGVGLFYLGSLLAKVEEDVANSEPPVPVAELLQSVEKVRDDALESQQRMEQMLNQVD